MLLDAVAWPTDFWRHKVLGKRYEVHVLWRDVHTYTERLMKDSDAADTDLALFPF